MANKWGKSGNSANFSKEQNWFTSLKKKKKNQALHLQYTRKILMILLTDAGKEKHMTMLI